MRVNELFLFIKERHSIYLRKMNKEDKPWTLDPILQKYRFCNVYRELDKVTVWIRENWREPHQTDKDVWFAMAVARFFNEPDTLEAIGWPIPLKTLDILKAIGLHKYKSRRVFNPAYIVSTNGVAMDKVDYVVDRVLTPLWLDKDRIRPLKGDGLYQFFYRLKACHGLSGFMAGQIVADTKFTSTLLTAEDFMTFAVSGPGSRRGLNRIFNYPPEDNWTEKGWYLKLMKLKEHIDAYVAGLNMPPISAQDLQNCLCEFDKYERVRLGEGRPKQLYPGEYNDPQHNRRERKLGAGDGDTTSIGDGSTTDNS